MRAFATAVGVLLLQAVASSVSLQAVEEGNAVKPAAVKHFDLGNGWYQADSEHFRVIYTRRALAEQVIAIAEKTRESVAKRWFAEGEVKWPGKCDIYLHIDGNAYSKATGAPATSPGHSTIKAESSDASRLISLRVDLHIDHPSMVGAVLPHEITHATIAGRFGNKHIPRWADEGMAVLSEPEDKITAHLDKLPAAYKDKLAFSAGDLMRLEDYPSPDRVAAFYAQSVSLVKFLSERKQPQDFTNFVQDAQKVGYETAIKKHYEFGTVADLDKAWREKTIQLTPQKK